MATSAVPVDNEAQPDWLVGVRAGSDGRLSTSHAYVVAVRIAQAAYSSSTTHGLRNGTVIQRCFRDINAGNAHFLTAEQSLIDAGKVLAGIEGAAVVF